jgi:hypothetical protein
VVVRSQELERTGRLGQVLVRPLWEVLVLVLAAAALYELQTRGAGPVEVQGRPAQVDRLQVLFPLLLIAGLAGAGHPRRSPAGGPPRSPGADIGL